MHKGNTLGLVQIKVFWGSLLIRSCKNFLLCFQALWGTQQLPQSRLTTILLCSSPFTQTLPPNTQLETRLAADHSKAGHLQLPHWTAKTITSSWKTESSEISSVQQMRSSTLNELSVIENTLLALPPVAGQWAKHAFCSSSTSSSVDWFGVFKKKFHCERK